MKFLALDVIAALAAQHVVDLFDSDCACECPRCCLACRALEEVFDSAPTSLGYRLHQLGVEDHVWQDSRGGFDQVVIRTRWHSPCPVYADLDGGGLVGDERGTEEPGPTATDEGTEP